MTKFAMTKIVLRDLDGETRFFRSVWGFDLERRVMGEGFAETILSRGDGAGGVLVLLADGSAPSPGEAVMVSTRTTSRRSPRA